MPRRTAKQIRHFFGKIHRSDFSDFAKFKESPAVAWVGLIVFALAITWLTSFSVSSIPDKVNVATVLKTDIRADKKITIFNEEETEKDRQAAAESVLPVFDYDETVPDEVEPKVKRVLSKPIVLDTETLTPYRKTGIVLRRLYPPQGTSQEETEIIIKDLSKVLTVAKAKRSVSLKNQTWIAANATFNLKETEVRKTAAVRSVKEKTITYQPGDFILRKGTKVEPEHMALLDRVRKGRGTENQLFRFFGAFLFVLLALSATFYFSERFVKRFLPEKKDYLLMGLVIIVMLCILRGSLILAGGLHDAFFYDIPRSALYYAVPIAGSVMLVRMVLTAEVSLVLAVIISLLAGLTVGSDVNYTTYCLISCIAAGSTIQKADHRSAIMRAGLWTGLINAVAVLGVQMVQASATTTAFQLHSITAHVGFAFLGGLMTSVFVFLGAPIMEYLLDYTTDIKLLELANLNHPLLKELIVRAPGTYHHSHIVGVLAEAGAEAIGANPLLARVSAYYHDIGKMKKPGYFVENDPNAYRRHEELSPHMSALIISSHVKEGIALARTHRLPTKIINMIPEHHGTKQIGFFYRKAKEQTDPNVEQVEEKDFRYPGPKPQSREAGVLMLADGAEASVRALKEKSPTRIRQMVEKMIDSSFAEAQLDECDLTLKDLHEIAKAFTRILIALYHQRVEYDKKESTSAPVAKTIPDDSHAIGKENVHRIPFPKGN